MDFCWWSASNEIPVYPYSFSITEEIDDVDGEDDDEEDGLDDEGKLHVAF